MIYFILVIHYIYIYIYIHKQAVGLELIIEISRMW